MALKIELPEKGPLKKTFPKKYLKIEFPSLQKMALKIKLPEKGPLKKTFPKKNLKIEFPVEVPLNRDSH
ncbi:hypothetical protein BpHYR1_025200 [Brachionus plicatilis]|uniref:Uncharacterized protein n=1 Tax=Brachionus plicatilis TaxID=10195 RepID=A0A3M7SID1_BRAPC|nr:hypothetical protein BpHYR1_025200 [Brachionus plicatilis]